MIGVGKIKQYSNVLDKPLSKGKQEVSLSAFAFLFSELVQYNQTQVDNIAELERRLEDAGYAVGARVLELLCHRDKGNRRETRLLGILSFVHSTVWKVLFGKVADSLEKGTEHEDEYMISEKELLVNRFISIPKDMGTFNCGAFVAGIVRGVLDSAGFPAVVTAHFVPMEGQQRPRTTILIKFAEEAGGFSLLFMAPKVYAKDGKTITFTQTKRDGDEVSTALTNSIASETLHGVSSPNLNLHHPFGSNESATPAAPIAAICDPQPPLHVQQSLPKSTITTLATYNLHHQPSLRLTTSHSVRPSCRPQLASTQILTSNQQYQANHPIAVNFSGSLITQ
ncbi:unnamed protein product, partial [Dovyalis caffra]